MKITWINLKNLILSKNLKIQYIERPKRYIIWIQEGVQKYICEILKSNPLETDQIDFETNYKNIANQPINLVDNEGKQYVRSDSRPLDMTTYFTMAGDTSSPLGIGNGKELKWDFSNNIDDITAPTGFKRKRIEYNFIDIVRVKEGTIYFKDKLFGSYIDLYVVCPNGQMYLDNNKSPKVATVDTIVNNFVNKYFMMDTVVIGDELNTESSSSEIPTNYKFWLEITVPDNDVLSKGYVSMELYRNRTVIL